MARLDASDNMQTSQIICKWMWGDGGGVGWGGGWRREEGWGGILTLPGSFFSRERRWRCKHLPSREPHLLELMEACRQHTAGGNTLQVTSAHRGVDQYPQSISTQSNIQEKR